MGAVCVLLLGFVACLAAGPPADIAADARKFDDQTLAQLVGIRRIYVDRLSGGETAEQLRDLIIASLQRARLFILTENKDRADAFLRGSGEDIIFTDTFQSSDNLNMHGAMGIGGSASRSTSSRRGASASIGAGESESTRISERKHEASAAVRLVSKDGDVIWSTSQESLGAKFRGASADVADKITRQLVEDFARARRLAAPSAASNK
ncbi:MAG: hypothetical protein NTY38_24130 [Acidobacteria bacterium]|nr:hypothetical protein [Acidobacteriota bacterium]